MAKPDSSAPSVMSIRWPKTQCDYWSTKRSAARWVNARVNLQSIVTALIGSFRSTSNSTKQSSADRDGSEKIIQVFVSFVETNAGRWSSFTLTDIHTKLGPVVDPGGSLETIPARVHLNRASRNARLCSTAADSDAYTGALSPTISARN